MPHTYDFHYDHVFTEILKPHFFFKFSCKISNFLYLSVHKESERKTVSRFLR